MLSGYLAVRCNSQGRHAYCQSCLRLHNSSVDKRDHYKYMCVHLNIFADSNECAASMCIWMPEVSTNCSSLGATHLSLETPSISSLELDI